MTSQDADETKTSRRLSLTRDNSAQGGKETTPSRRLSLTRDDSAQGGEGKKPSRRLSMTRDVAAQGESPSKSHRMPLPRRFSSEQGDGAAKLNPLRRMSLSRGDSTQPEVPRKRRKSFTTELEDKSADEAPKEKTPRRASLSLGDAGGSRKLPLQRRALLDSADTTIESKTLSLQERRASLGKEPSNAFSVGSASKTCKVATDEDSDNSPFVDESSDDEGEVSLGESFDTTAARGQFQAWYRAKGRFDKDLIANLLPMATGRHYDVPNYGETFGGEEDDDEVTRARIRVTYRDTLIAVCGRPAFDDNCVGILTDLGFEDDQLVTFHRGNVPLGQVVPQYMTPTTQL